MFGKFSRKNDGPQDGAPTRAASDPLPGARLGGRIILERLLGNMKDERGVHVESLATALGALAGRDGNTDRDRNTDADSHTDRNGDRNTDADADNDDASGVGSSGRSRNRRFHGYRRRFGRLCDLG
ncbi:hypothetical protein [Pseudarthrobacter sp. PvP090]|uniref:hypothetical protein n=1 Tax=Pseudarthrobacter sp. PvP090 TaxID=3156393 RepID=UPI003398630E